MFQRSVLPFPAAILALLVLMLAGCVMPPRADERPTPAPEPQSAAPSVPEPVAEPTPEDPTAIVNQNANVRTGPGTSYPAAYWLHAGDEVTVVGRSEEGTWLQIEHQDRPGWISTRLVDFETAVAEVEAAPASAPTPEPEAPTTATVTGGPSSVRVGPGTDYAADGLVDDGQTVRIVGRNADATWLQIMHPVATGELVWISQAYADLDVAEIDRIRVVAAPPPPAPTEPVAVVIDDCTQWHTVNPNEEYLIDITTWYDLDLRAVARLNRIDPEIPLAVAEVCLLAPGIDTSAQDGHTPNAAPGPLSVTVTGTTVNLRTGPGTDHPTSGQVRAGDALHATGRNAAGDWLLIVHPAATGEQVWIYAPLTDISAASLQVLAIVSAVAIGTPPTQESAVPTPEPTQEPAAARPPVMPPGCTRIHTVNPNEQRLQQITDWFGLDLQTTAVLNAIEPDAPLIAGWQLCLPEAPDTSPAPDNPEPRPVRRSPSAGGDCKDPMGVVFPCLDIPDNPERGHPDAGIGPSVHTNYDVLWHAPGTYERDLPGLDHEFELVFTDISVTWDWTVRDFDACYDALRVHMGPVPEEAGLTRLEFRLADPFEDYLWHLPPSQAHTNMYHSPWGNPGSVPWDDWPRWDSTSLPMDLSVAAFSCYRGPWERTVCDIMPMWGNSHSIYLNAAVAQAMGHSLQHLSHNALEDQYSRVSGRVLEANSYLYPLADRIGDPVGHGPCADVWHAQ